MKYIIEWCIMQKHIFKAFDIGGVLGLDFSIQDSYKIAQAYVCWLEQQSTNLQRIAVAFDGRLHGQEIYQQVARAIVDAGYQVYFLGICPTPVFVHGLHHLPVQAGIMILTAGDVAGYHGFKLYFDQNLVCGFDLCKIYELSKNVKISQVEHSGKIVPCPIIDQYVDSMWQEFAHLSEYDFDIVIDCAYGATGSVMKKLLHRMGWQQVQLVNDLLDATFALPDGALHEPENMNFLKIALKKDKKLFGIALNCDGERMLAMESNGHMILGDRLLAMFVPDILEKYAHRVVLYDMPEQPALQSIIEQAHGKAVCVHLQEPITSESIEKYHAIFAAQLQGRFFFQDRHMGHSDGIYTMLRLFDLLIKNRTSLADMLKRIDVQFRQVQYGSNVGVPENIKEL